MRRTKRRGNALFRKVKQLYSTIVRKKIKGYSKNHKIFSKNEASQGRKGLGRGKNAIDSARAAGANAATRRAKSGRKVTSSEKAPRCQSPAARKPPPIIPPAPPGQMRPHAGRKAGEKGQAPKKRPGVKARPPGSRLLLFRPRRRAWPFFLFPFPVRRGRAGRVGERGTAVAPTKHLGKIQGIPIAAERRAFGHRTPLPQ